MLGNYVYMGPEGYNLCLFRQERTWLPAGLIESTLNGVAVITLFPNGVKRLNKESKENKEGKESIKIEIKRLVNDRIY